MSPLLFALLAFLAVALAVLGAYSFLSDLFLRDRSRLGRRVDEEFRTRQRERMRKTVLFKDLAQLAAEAGAEDDVTPRRRFEMMVEQSGLEVTPGRVMAIAGCLALGCGLLGTMLRGSALVGLILAAVAGPLPVMYVWAMRRRRLLKLQSQLPEAFDLMSRVIRAGQTMTQALQGVADDFEKPISAEFSYCCEQQNLGLPPEASLRDLARRTGILEVRIFVLAMLIQQQTGGNLAEMLDKLARVMRDRTRVLGKIRTLTAEGRLQALVLLALPPFLLLIIMVINPDYGSTLLEHPNLLVGMVASEALGALWIRKIVNFDF
ncbi:MAG TPA: type II secretion system F family protein [Gemmataceae bacterium]|nr:type II secretion system F family protein [Gemmataceae bacterium]